MHSNSFRYIRGRSLVACIFDEVAFWRDELSAAPDIEVYRAVLPSLLRMGGVLIGISTPYRKSGLLLDKFRNHFGQEGDDVLVVRGATTAFNPHISQAKISKAMLADPEAAASEWEAEFRSDLTALFDDAVIDDAVDHGRPLELPPRYGRANMSPLPTPLPAGRCFRHYHRSQRGPKEETRFVADVVRGRPAPFDPRIVPRNMPS